MKDALWQQVLPLLPPSATATSSTATVRPDFGLDPLDFVEMVLRVEAHFGIRFSDAEVEELRTVQLLLRSVERSSRLSLYAEFFAQLLQNGHWL